MQRYILSRIAQGLLVMFIVSVVVFFLARISGDPTYGLLDERATKEAREILRQFLGLDKPIHEQYLTWAGNVLHGNLGTSLRTGYPVIELIQMRLPYTIQLAAIAFLVALGIGLPLGLLAALKKDSVLDWVAKSAAFLGMSAPHFWVAIMLVLVFSVELRWFPTSGTGTLSHYVLPAVTLGFGVTAAGVLRLTRSGMLDVLDTEYIKLARVIGVPARRVIMVHALRNALIPVVTYVGVYFSLFLSGSVIVEQIFRWPGIGLLTYEAVLWRDFPLLQGVLLLVCVWIILVNLVIDILYAYIDPRIRY